MKSKSSQKVACGSPCAATPWGKSQPCPGSTAVLRYTVVATTQGGGQVKATLQMGDGRGEPERPKRASALSFPFQRLPPPKRHIAAFRFLCLAMPMVTHIFVQMPSFSTDQTEPSTMICP